MTELQIPTDVQEQALACEKMLRVAREFVIDTPEMLDTAADELKKIKAKSKDLEDQRKRMTKPLDDSKKQIMDFFRGPLQFLADAESAIKRAMLTFSREQERKRQEAEAAAREKARKEQERLEARAKAAAEKGQEEKAEQLMQQAESVPVPIVPQAAQAPAGISMRETWRAEVVDKMALIKAVAAGEVPDLVLIVDMKVLNAQARALKSALRYPGVQAVSEQTVAARTA